MSEQTQEEAVSCPVCWSIHTRTNTAPRMNCIDCGALWLQNKRRPSPPQAFDPGWRGLPVAMEHGSLVFRNPAPDASVGPLPYRTGVIGPSLTAPSPPATDIAQVRQRFEAWLMENDYKGDTKGEFTKIAYIVWCAALGAKP